MREKMGEGNQEIERERERSGTKWERMTVGIESGEDKRMVGVPEIRVKILQTKSRCSVDMVQLSSARGGLVCVDDAKNCYSLILSLVTLSAKSLWRWAIIHSCFPP